MQNYANHRRFYPAHHFVLTPLTAMLFVYTIISVFTANNSLQENILHVLVGTILLILPQMTRLYALKNQNRMIRMEVRYRYFELTGKSFSEKESKLKSSQIIGLRFAGDNELVELTERAIAESLSNTDIKKAIKNWKADNYRV